MSSIIFEKWIWIIIGCCVVALVLPYFILLLIYFLPETIRAAAVFIIVALWGIVAGYKDWLMDARKREEKWVHE
jgi:hypothetical protein